MDKQLKHYLINFRKFIGSFGKAYAAYIHNDLTTVNNDTLHAFAKYYCAYSVDKGALIQTSLAEIKRYVELRGWNENDSLEEVATEYYENCIIHDLVENISSFVENVYYDSILGNPFYNEKLTDDDRPMIMDNRDKYVEIVRSQINIDEL